MSPTPTDMLHGTCCAAIYFADSGPVTLKHPAAHFASGTTAPKVANTATSEDREKGTRHQVRPVRSLQFFFFSNSIVQKYCPIDLNMNVRIFWRPTVENILKYRIVVVSLNISMELAWLDLPKGHFTHIFLD
ncbi:probable helicase with zinc finger domain isoform X2 [Culex quinquefasciatus]|uniref:probable helicase with zinc finger domain isoform X2 n=1 Tax=Culex quinquefasciatus TaxID=7176 RepID=UPI0018E35C53|nr:probable helicase with zinc finger domain isoform X2 [Culex quinquefasciatus]